MKIAKSILELYPTCGSLRLHIDIAFDFLSTLIQCNDNHMVIAFARVLVRRCNQLDEIVLVFVSAQPTHFLLRKDEPKSPTCDEHDNEKHSRDTVNWIKRIKCARHVGVKLYAMHTFAFSLDAQQKLIQRHIEKTTCINLHLRVCLLFFYRIPLFSVRLENRKRK